jgi:polysaccharide deacetylase family protein (PEP-CTERM system associated)
MKNTVLLTLDIEEWFQVANLSSAISQEDWNTQNSSVERNVNRILAILERHQISATFFFLGWVAERHPELVRKVQAKGHEVASHGYGHQLANQLEENELKKDILHSKQILEQITGEKIVGYRAPNFSVNDRILYLLKELGFQYDSSYNPFKLNTRYGSLESIREKVASGCWQTASGLFEIPLSQTSIGGFPFPIGGGAYFRIFPLWIFKGFVKGKLKVDPVYNFYLHPWEFEPEQKRIKNIRFDYRFRHYYGLNNTAEKLEKLIVFLKEMGSEFLTIREYISRIKVNG